MTKERAMTDSVLWAAAVLYIALNLGVGLRVLDLGNAGSVVITLLLFAFVLLYGSKRYGWRTLLIFFGITAIISWSMDSLSIATGFPFGDYHYSSNLGPKLGTVPLIIIPAYFANGFLAWTISHIFLNNLSTNIAKRNLVVAPVIASFVMVMWDFCIDPVTSTIDQDWVWENGGNYFGVPIKNYFGWFLTVFLIYQTFTVYLSWRNNSNAPPANPLQKSYWFLAPVMFIGTASLGLVHPLANTTHPQIYWSMFLATVMTMIFVSFLAIVLVSRFEP